MNSFFSSNKDHMCISSDPTPGIGISLWVKEKRVERGKMDVEDSREVDAGEIAGWKDQVTEKEIQEKKVQRTEPIVEQQQELGTQYSVTVECCCCPLLRSCISCCS